MEGPSLSALQRMLLAAGVVAVPYLWTRISSRIAAAAVAGVCVCQSMFFVLLLASLLKGISWV